MSNTNPYWRFAPTNGGAEQSNNPGQVTFADAPVSKAVRELLQNSLDHPDTGLDGVTVNFTLLDLPSEYCNASQLTRHIRQATQLLESENDPQNAERYRRAAAALSQPTIKTLAVTDSGTTGLVDPNWHNLIYREGRPASDRNAAHGGSYGFGKNAPFNLSLANAVLYTTRYVSKPARGRVIKMAGRSQLISHPDPATGEQLQAIGFFGHHQDGAYNRPVTGSDIPDPPLLLPETGAGVFILAFNPDYDDWVDLVAQTVATDFFAAVHDHKLEVGIRKAPDAEPRIVNRDTLDLELDRLDDRHPSRFYCRAYRESAPILTKPSGKLGGMGQLQLRILTDPKAPRKLAHINIHGMLVTDSGVTTENPFYPTGGRQWSPWCAVTMAADAAADKYIRRTEPPAHNAVQYRILAKPDAVKAAQQEYKIHREQISQLIRDHIEKALDNEEHNIRELAKLFPDQPDADSGATRVKSRQMRRNVPGAIPGVAATKGEGTDIPPERERRRHPGSNTNPNPNPDPNHKPPPSDPSSNATAQPDLPAIPYARAMQTAPDIITVRIQLPETITEKGVAFTVRQAGEERQKYETELSVKHAAAYGTLAAQAHAKGNAIQVTGEPGAEVSVKLTLRNPSDAKAGFRTTQVPTA